MSPFLKVAQNKTKQKKEDDTLSIIFVAKKGGVVLSVSGVGWGGGAGRGRGDELDIVLCVKASVHAHTYVR